MPVSFCIVRVRDIDLPSKDTAVDAGLCNVEGPGV